jgi:hypothetical protein
MKIHVVTLLFAFDAIVLAAGCVPPGAGATNDDNSQLTHFNCVPCASSTECMSGWSCAQFGGDSYCAPMCAAGQCSSSARSCATLSSVEGDQQDVCVPTQQVCGDPAQQPFARRHRDAGVSPPDANVPPPPDAGGSCGALIPPDAPAGCSSCSSGGHTCQANGCYGGWWCNSDTNRCQAPPQSCGSADAGAPDLGPVDTGAGDAQPIDTGAPDAAPLDAGASDAQTTADAGSSGTIGPQGGTLDRLSFAIVGDTRPPAIDDTSGYPSAVAQQIWRDVQQENPRPAFAVTTGDYMFARATGNQAMPQLDLYLSARALFSNIVFPAMGNHECTGATNSNCTGSGQSNNYDAYMQRMLQPLGQTLPYYAIDIGASDGSWTAKFVFIAANAWDSAQQSWLDNVLSQSTTYTFVLRHERSSVTTPPGVSPSNQILAQHPYTMLIVGHTHTYSTYSSREVVVGNGGAPLTGGVNYGYVVAAQRADGAIVFTEKDYSSLSINDTFVVRPDGTLTN